jgi:hypothetical protein
MYILFIQLFVVSTAVKKGVLFFWVVLQPHTLAFTIVSQEHHHHHHLWHDIPL